MENKGFTLVELLAVIVILGLLIAVAAPQVFKSSSKVKNKAYDTKITNFKAAVVEYGETIKNEIKTGKYFCHFTYKNETIESVTFDNDSSGTNTYPCQSITIGDLAKDNYIDYDEGTSVINPTNNKVINACNIYVYEKNGYLYGAFDKAACDTLTK